MLDSLFDADLVPTQAAAAPPADPFTARREAERQQPLTRPRDRPTLLAIDGNSLTHRSYHAYAGGRDHGDLVGAGLYGLLALTAAVADVVRPAAIVVGFDCRNRSARKERWPAYKAHRAGKPEPLDRLLDAAPAVLRRLGAYVVVPEAWEADDVCGSAAAAAEAAKWRCVIATSDRDAWSQVAAHTEVLRLRSGVRRAQWVDERRVRLQTGIDVSQYVQFAALRGDPSDNLPGIHGIGRKLARDLLRRFATVEEAVADPLACRSVLGPDLGQALIDDLGSPESIFRRNVELMTIRRDLPVDVERGRPQGDPAAIERLLRERRLAGLIARMVLTFGNVTADVPPPTDADVPLLVD